MPPSSEPRRTRPQVQNKYVTSTVIQTYQSLAKQYGMDADTFSSRTGIAQADIQGPPRRIRGDQHLRALQLFQTSGIPVLPKPETAWFDGFAQFYPDLISLLVNSATLRHALRHLVQHRLVIGNLDTLDLLETPTKVMLVHEQPDSASINVCGGLGHFMLANQIARCYDPHAHTSTHIHLQPLLPTSLIAALASTDDCRISIVQTQETWTCASPLLDTPLRQFNPWLERFARQRLDQQIQDLHASGSFTQQVGHKALALLLSASDANSEGHILSDLCQCFNMSRWTMQRRLNLEGATFAGIFSQVRSEEMKRLLETTALSIAEVGDRLGFATPTSLTRFCKQQTGHTPSEYRQRLQNAPMAKAA